MNMRCKIALILLAALAVFITGLSQAQDAGNATNVTNVTAALNDTNVSINATIPVAAATVAVVPAEEPAAEAETASTENASEVASAAAPVESETAPASVDSRFKQLSVYAGESTVLGKNATEGYTDVSATTDRSAVFTRDAGVMSPSTKLGISKVGPGDDKYVEVTSQAVGEWDLAGWSLSSGGSTTFTFPSVVLEQGEAVRVHEGTGTASATDIYTNSSDPLWVGSLVSLLDADGDIISTFDISAQPAQVKWIDPLARQIQF
jgi:hypothetical protein